MSIRLLTISLAVLVAGATTVQAGMRLQPHRAVYELKMTEATQGSGIAGTSGAIFYEFTEQCDGWHITNRTILRTLFEEGPERTSDWSYTSWESHDGSSYRFEVQSMVNGRQMETIRGTAGLTEEGGVARFTEPERKTIKLTRDTVFPTRHIENLVAAAQNGTQFLLADVFDGFAADTPYYSINAFLGPLLKPADQPRPGLDTDSWRMRLAFFEQGSRSEEPSYELGIRYFENGVASEILQDFGDMKIDGELREIELLPRPEC